MDDIHASQGAYLSGEFGLLDGSFEVKAEPRQGGHLPDEKMLGTFAPVRCLYSSSASRV
jgi:hypothetical protein